MKGYCHALEIFFKLNEDHFTKKNWLPDYLSVNKNFLVSLVNGLHQKKLGANTATLMKKNVVSCHHPALTVKFSLILKNRCCVLRTFQYL